MVMEKFQIYSVMITANTFFNQNIQAVRFYSCSKHKSHQVFIIIPQADENCPFPPNSVF